MLHTLSNPANPAWNCCRENPGAVVTYPDGSAMVVCKRDSVVHFRPEDRHELPEDWKVETNADLWKRVVEDVRRAHFDTATSEEMNVAGGSNYRRSQEAFIAAIRMAYPQYDADQIYGLWLDNNESIAYQVSFIDRDPETAAKFRSY